jgi:hypothetical protein
LFTNGFARWTFQTSLLPQSLLTGKSRGVKFSQYNAWAELLDNLGSITGKGGRILSSPRPSLTDYAVHPAAHPYWGLLQKGKVAEA